MLSASAAWLEFSPTLHGVSTCTSSTILDARREELVEEAMNIAPLTTKL
jgi:hypothetical protein